MIQDKGINSAVIISKMLSLFNIEWIYQLKNNTYQIKWEPEWSHISVVLPKMISDQIFYGIYSKYITELDHRTWQNNNKSYWCYDDVNVYGWHWWNHAQNKSVQRFLENVQYNISFLKQLKQFPFSKILRHIEDNETICSN
eukprot:210007_1